MPTVMPAAPLALRPSEAVPALSALINADQPAVLWGPPGIGKSQIVQQTGAALGLTVIDIRAALLDPVDLRGLPHVNGDGRAHWATPEWLPRDGNCLLFLDELNRAPTLVMNGFFQLMLKDAAGERRIGEYVAPPGLRILAACNRETDGGGVTRMSSALSGRFIHLDLTTDVNDWSQWAVTAGIEPMVLAFIRFRPDLLHQFDPKERSSPAPRGWEFVSKVVAQQTPQAIELALVAGAVGHPAAIEFTAFARIFKNLPSIDAILLNPTQAAVPTDVATLYAVSAALAHRADANNFSRVIQFLDRLPSEYAVFSVKDAVTRTPALTSTSTFTAWSIAHANLI